MNIIKYEKISLPGKQINEDSAAITSTGAWVLDGATGLGDNRIHEKSDAKWFVDQWNDYLLKHINNMEYSLKEIVKAGIIEIKHHYYQYVKEKIEPIDLPSSGIALIRWRDKIEYFLLGDCSLLIKKEEEPIKKYKDHKLEVLDNQVISAIRALIRNKNLSLLEAREQVKDMLIKNRLLKNTSNGYWILGFDQKAVDYAITGQIIHENMEVLMMTDGFSAIEDKYAYIKENQLFDDAKEKGLKYLYNLIREIENKDPDGIQYPRLKQSDDASAVYIQLG